MCQRYFSEQAASYDDFDESIARRRDYCRAVDEQVVNALKAHGASSLISFGCGTGRRELGIAEQISSGRRITIRAIETAEPMAHLARAKGLEVKMEWPDTWSCQNADAVLALFSFVHVSTSTDRSRWINRFARALKPDGLLMLDIFNLFDETEWGPEIARRHQIESWYERGYDLGDVFYRRLEMDEVAFMHYFSIGEISSIVESCGFTITSIMGIGYGSSPGEIGVPLNRGNLLLTCRRGKEYL